ncbi:hypothetical protein ACA910_004590 [Epithemia clementina (nom. ined.)]
MNNNKGYPTFFKVQLPHPRKLPQALMAAGGGGGGGGGVGIQRHHHQQQQPKGTTNNSNNKNDNQTDVSVGVFRKIRTRSILTENNGTPGTPSLERLYHLLMESMKTTRTRTKTKPASSVAVAPNAATTDTTADGSTTTTTVKRALLCDDPTAIDSQEPTKQPSQSLIPVPTEEEGEDCDDDQYEFVYQDHEGDWILIADSNDLHEALCEYGPLGTTTTTDQRRSAILTTPLDANLVSPPGQVVPACSWLSLKIVVCLPTTTTTSDSRQPPPERPQEQTSTAPAGRDPKDNVRNVSSARTSKPEEPLLLSVPPHDGIHQNRNSYNLPQTHYRSTRPSTTFYQPTSNDDDDAKEDYYYHSLNRRGSHAPKSNGDPPWCWWNNNCPRCTGGSNHEGAWHETQYYDNFYQEQQERQFEFPPKTLPTTTRQPAPRLKANAAAFSSSTHARPPPASVGSSATMSRNTSLKCEVDASKVTTTSGQNENNKNDDKNSCAKSDLPLQTTSTVRGNPDNTLNDEQTSHSTLLPATVANPSPPSSLNSNGNNNNKNKRERKPLLITNKNGEVLDSRFLAWKESAVNETGAPKGAPIDGDHAKTLSPAAATTPNPIPTKPESTILHDHQDGSVNSAAEKGPQQTKRYNEGEEHKEQGATSSASTDTKHCLEICSPKQGNDLVKKKLVGECDGNLPMDRDRLDCVLSENTGVSEDVAEWQGEKGPSNTSVASASLLPTIPAASRTLRPAPSVMAVEITAREKKPLVISDKNGNVACVSAAHSPTLARVESATAITSSSSSKLTSLKPSAVPWKPCGDLAVATAQQEEAQRALLTPAAPGHSSFPAVDSNDASAEQGAPPTTQQQEAVPTESLVPVVAVENATKKITPVLTEQNQQAPDEKEALKVTDEPKQGGSTIAANATINAVSGEATGSAEKTIKGLVPVVEPSQETTTHNERLEATHTNPTDYGNNSYQYYCEPSWPQKDYYQIAGAREGVYSSSQFGRQEPPPPVQQNLQDHGYSWNNTTGGHFSDDLGATTVAFSPYGMGPEPSASVPTHYPNLVPNNETNHHFGYGWQ